MIKGFVILAAAGAMAISMLTGCSGNTAETQAASTAQDALPSVESEPEKETEGKTLIVYYSATGNTERAANMIKDYTGGELFELEPAVQYSDTDLNWSNDNSRVVKEHDNPEQREVELVSTTVDDWESVSVVYLGYPIWWGIAAWPVDGFVQANDFTGKTVIPFCTSTSSGLGESGSLLAEMAGTGDWREGVRFSSGVSENDVKTWIEGLEL